jgi:hypothetical protein
MLLVILGAGASFDSIGELKIRADRVLRETEFRPPLADQLFAERDSFRDARARYRILGGLTETVTNAMHRGAGLEEALEAEVRRAPHDPRVRAEMLALRGYLRDVILRCLQEWTALSGAATNHHWLFRHLSRWAHATSQLVAVATFNYDLFAEIALTAQAGITFTDVNTYGRIHEGGRTGLFKLHGSVNWFREVSETNLTLDEIVAAVMDGADIEEEGDIRMDADRGGIVPAIAVPVTTKSSYECPQTHLEHLRQLLPEVDLVLVIGWRATEQHFLSMLHELGKYVRTVLVVSGTEEGANETVKHLSGILPGSRRTFVKTDDLYFDGHPVAGFSGLGLSLDVLDAFLAS